MSATKSKRGWQTAAVVVVVLLLGAGVVYLLFGKRWKARHDVHELYSGLNYYLAEQGSFPEGSPAEIAALLLGDSVRGQNSSRKPYIEALPQELNDEGAFIDPWGTPYRIQIDTAPVVWSCGPNQQDEGGSGDDIVWPRESPAAPAESAGG